ncbi:MULTISPECIES: response regulator transcription factor [unclassified Variovorax]|jgi:two-component system OmpR family response regulator|uniref:response regulator n=1 Tax=Variovorax TaxID=34072 RepID=UPI0008F07CE7|nr:MULTISPECIES: response regulator transcription factor [unclassified Variovorax]KAF1069285.1 MAG: Transcriptional regulatory protein BasR [Variovorax sp.]QRF56464.1 response regulator transcription factor [Variovorax paradoxus]TAJ60004.1 MAG: response regulator transcription factor [Variovorax sp.]SFO10497.1 two-component system, OmpR family, response regulator BasR/two-component system, OmpR family, response regulator TctD [Variovorax sp. PDC80]
MRILLVEDEAELAQALAAALRQNQAVVDVAGSLREAQDAVLAGQHEVIVLDRGLPDGDGLSLIEFLRANGIAAAVLVLTAMADISERVLSLDGGADDYLAKPFSMDELMARVRALARRPALRANPVTALARLQFDHLQRQAHVDAQSLLLTRRELLVLEALLEQRGRTVLRESLHDRVYGQEGDIHSNALDTHVSRLRSKLDKAGAQVEIHAIRGVGYLLCAAPGAA